MSFINCSQTQTFNVYIQAGQPEIPIAANALEKVTFSAIFVLLQLLH